MSGEDSVSIHLTDLIAAVVGTHGSTCVIAPLLLLDWRNKTARGETSLSVDRCSSSRHAGAQLALTPGNLIA